MCQHMQGSASGTAGKKAQWQRNTDWRASLGVCQAVEPCGRSFAAPAFEKLLGLNCPEAADVLNSIVEGDALDVGHQKGSEIRGTVHAGHAVNINGAACDRSIEDTGPNAAPSFPTARRVGQSDVVVARPRAHVGTLLLKGLSETRENHLHTVLAEKVGIFRLGKAPEQNNGLAP